ncbi:MAG: hypothetical protein JRL30_01220 [Deltaproteobacteria bacterium]|nr:hypothetical protein [Deltaproteobacteria bacterium]
MIHTKVPWTWAFDPGWPRDVIDAAKGIYGGLSGPGDEEVIEYAGCGSYEIEIKKPGDRALLRFAPNMYVAIRRIQDCLDQKIDPYLGELGELLEAIEIEGASPPDVESEPEPEDEDDDDDENLADDVAPPGLPAKKGSAK